MQFDLNFGDEFYANELFDIESYKFNGGMSSRKLKNSYQVTKLFMKNMYKV